MALSLGLFFFKISFEIKRQIHHPCIYTSKLLFLSLKSRKMSKKTLTLVLGKTMKKNVRFNLPASDLKPSMEKRDQGT